MISIDRLQQLIQKGETVLQTHRPNPSFAYGFPTLNSGEFTAWQTQVLNYLQTNLPSNNPYIISFQKNVTKGFCSNVEQGIGILNSIIEDINLNLLESSDEEIFNPINSIVKI